MRIFKNISLILLVLFILEGCKELYKPEISTDQSAIVIQGMLTNNPGELEVTITKAVPYGSDSKGIPIIDCNVTIKDDKGKIYPLTYNRHGKYTNATLYALEGETYSLNVVTADGDEFRSDNQTLPPKYKQDSIYGAKVSIPEFIPDSYGGYFKSTKQGTETYVDLSSGSTDLPKCLYTSRVTVLYYYVKMGLPPTTIYCWTTFTPSNEINLTTSTFDKTQGIIQKHPLCFFETLLNKYDPRPDVNLSGFLIAVKKYNLTPGASRYYKAMKEQMEASGKIFDPIPSQVRGNIKCTNNPEKIVYGLFEVTNIEQLYYRYNSNGTSLTARSGFPEFTDRGETDTAPAFWMN